jgi:hypothetical protein
LQPGGTPFNSTDNLNYIHIEPISITSTNGTAKVEDSNSNNNNNNNTDEAASALTPTEGAEQLTCTWLIIVCC